jgi:hypothetical protein
MNQSRIAAHQVCTPALTVHERREFDFVIANARSSGWIAVDQEIIAERSGTSVSVRSQRVKAASERSYRYRQRWLFELLHDLAHGLWKQHTT